MKIFDTHKRYNFLVSQRNFMLHYYLCRFMNKNGSHQNFSVGALEKSLLNCSYINKESM